MADGPASVPAGPGNGDATGERMDPSAHAGRLIEAEHRARYRLAASLARGRKVLDVACGEGYGAETIRAAGAEEVVAADIDEPTVAAASERYPEVDFRVADVREMPFSDGEFDLVVCFETVEHVEGADRAVAELRRVTREDGLVLVSTPNVVRHAHASPFHVEELDERGFRAMLEPRFEEVRILDQDNWLCSVVGPPDAREVGFEPVGALPDPALYMVALCGPSPLPEPATVAMLAEVHEAHELTRRLDEALRWNRELDAMRVRAEEKLRSVVESRSWRITRPLRRLSERSRR